MTQEEKAKAYDEALEQAKKELRTDLHESGVWALKRIFPELADSEDERIRKEIIDYLGLVGKGKGDYVQPMIDRWIAYLEKLNDFQFNYPGIYFYDGKKLHFQGNPAMEENPYDFAMSQQEKQKEPIDPFDTKLFQDGVKEGRRLEREDIEKEQDNEEGDFTIYHPQKNGEGKYECIPFSFYGSLTSFSNDKDLMDFLNECFYDKEECERWCEVENKPELSECNHKIKKDSVFDYLCESSSDEKQKEQKPVEYLDLDNASQDYVYNHFCPGADFTPDYIKGLMEDAFVDGANWQKEQKPAEWSEEDERMKQDIIQFIKTGWTDNGKSHLIPWLKSLPERFNLQPKQEWSEEDERIKSCIDLALTDVDEQRFKDFGTTLKDCLDWLKSLRPQSRKELSIEKAIQWLDDTFYFLDNSSGRGRDCEITTHDFDSLEEMYDSFRKAVIVDSEPFWKPSEEQMEALKHCVNGWQDTADGDLESLYNDLKKLM